MQFGTVLIANNIAARGLQGEVRFEYSYTNDVFIT